MSKENGYIAQHITTDGIIIPEDLDHFPIVHLHRAGTHHEEWLAARERGRMLDTNDGQEFIQLEDGTIARLLRVEPAVTFNGEHENLNNFRTTAELNDPSIIEGTDRVPPEGEIFLPTSELSQPIELDSNRFAENWVIQYINKP